MALAAILSLLAACGPTPTPLVVREKAVVEATATPAISPKRLREAEKENERALAYHRERRLKEASQVYMEVLALDPPRQPSPEELELARRFAPRIYITPSEPFPLEDFVVIVHPDRPFIAYHLFWDDDIDYPEDNDPTDHEVVWVEYDPVTLEVVNVFTYYHKRILTTQEAVEDAHAHAQRPRIEVQWGKHGSLPVGWEGIKAGVEPIEEDMRRTYERLHEEGHRLLDHPLAKDWPRKFTGSWKDFVDFSRHIDPVELIAAKGMVMVSRWSNAVIDQYFLPYNFYPKREWPFE